jgi:hypothetical protein
MEANPRQKIYTSHHWECRPQHPDTYTRDKASIDITYQGYVTFNQMFTYIGFIITNDLKDSADINVSIGTANAILHSLNNLWRRTKGLSVRIKKQFYIMMLVMNIVLWGS